MRTLIFPSLLRTTALMVFFTACASAPTEKRVSLDFTIVPGERVGRITAKTSEAELRKIYGDDNVQSAVIPVAIGAEKGTLLYPNDPKKKIAIFWKDDLMKTAPASVELNGDATDWSTPDGIRLGTSLKEIEKRNGKPFLLSGFGWDFSGTVLSWEGGKLQNALMRKGRVLLRLAPMSISIVKPAEYDAMLGEGSHSSDEPVMQKLDPTVYEIVVEFP